MRSGPVSYADAAASLVGTLAAGTSAAFVFTDPRAAAAGQGRGSSSAPFVFANPPPQCPASAAADVVSGLGGTVQPGVVPGAAAFRTVGPSMTCPRSSTGGATPASPDARSGDHLP